MEKLAHFKMKIIKISDEQIALFHEYLRFDTAQGKLFWKKKIAKKTVIGAEAGSRKALGYRQVQLLGVPYLAHRVIFAMVHGFCPNEIDHVNGNPSDNRPENLRPATRSQQNMNRATQTNNTSGQKGVYWFKPGSYWHARIKVNGKNICLGYFKDIKAAAEAYKLGSEKYHGEYRRAY